MWYVNNNNMQLCLTPFSQIHDMQLCLLNQCRHSNTHTHTPQHTSTPHYTTSTHHYTTSTHHYTPPHRTAPYHTPPHTTIHHHTTLYHTPFHLSTPLIRVLICLLCNWPFSPPFLVHSFTFLPKHLDGFACVCVFKDKLMYFSLWVCVLGEAALFHCVCV